MSTPAVAQVGGDHYDNSTGNAHWDLMERWDVSYLEATASKYVVRWDRKGTPLGDLGKARSYLLKLLSERPNVRRTIPEEALREFKEVNGLSEEKWMFMLLIHGLGDQESLNEAVHHLNLMIVSEALDGARK